MKNRCARHATGDKQCDVSIDTLIERFKKIRALNCTNPYDVGLDGYVWKQFIIATRAHLVTKMF
jgi:hypothetical protein